MVHVHESCELEIVPHCAYIAGALGVDKPELIMEK